MKEIKKPMKPSILKKKEKGEYQDYIDQTYETIDHEKHEEFIEESNE